MVIAIRKERYGRLTEYGGIILQSSTFKSDIQLN
jgi:hypothetical protein